MKSIPDFQICYNKEISSSEMPKRPAIINCKYDKYGNIYDNCNDSAMVPQM